MFFMAGIQRTDPIIRESIAGCVAGDNSVYDLFRLGWRKPTSHLNERSVTKLAEHSVNTDRVMSETNLSSYTDYVRNKMS